MSNNNKYQDKSYVELLEMLREVELRIPLLKRGRQVCYNAGNDAGVVYYRDQLVTHLQMQSDLMIAIRKVENEVLESMPIEDVLLKAGVDMVIVEPGIKHHVYVIGGDISQGIRFKKFDSVPYSLTYNEPYEKFNIQTK